MSGATQCEAASLVHQLLQAVESVLDAFALGGLESLEPGREPGSAPAANRSQHLRAFGCEVEADAAAVARALPLDQVRRLEADEVARHPGRRHALAVGEL